MVSALEVQAASIAVQNDEFRSSGFGVVLTNGIQSIPRLPELLQRVRVYDDFTEDNDPYGEHDFGSLVWEGQKVFWKIDYYDRNLEFGEYPMSPNCRKVLTVMLADEY